AAPRFLVWQLWIAFLVLAGVGQLDRRAVDNFDRTASQSPAFTHTLVGVVSQVVQSFFETFPRQAQSCLAISTAVLYPALSPEPEEGLHLAHDFAAGGLRFEQLPD